MITSRTVPVTGNALEGLAGEQTRLTYAQQPAAGRHQRNGDEITATLYLAAFCIQFSHFKSGCNISPRVLYPKYSCGLDSQNPWAGA